MTVRFTTKIRFNGREYASAEEMPPSVREAYTRAVGETAVLRSGARLAGKLNAKVIVNGKEFSNPGELPVTERRLLQDALGALLPDNLALSADESHKIRRKKLSLGVVAVVVIGTVVYLWLQGFFG
jgi:hypothetical protein